MEQKTLKYLRVFIPGFIIVLGLYPIYLYYLPELFDLKSLDSAYVIFLSLLLGGVYYQLNIQHLLTSPSHYFIRRNILNKLIKASELTINKDQLNKLKFKDNYMTIFYRIIDNDESLKRKGENVRFNGIFWTSTADAALICICFYLIYSLFFKEIKNFEELRSVFLYTSLVSLLLHIVSVVKHINLSNKQLDPIIESKELSNKVVKYFNEYLDQTE